MDDPSQLEIKGVAPPGEIVEGISIAPLFGRVTFLANGLLFGWLVVQLSHCLFKLHISFLSGFSFKLAVV